MSFGVDKAAKNGDVDVPADQSERHCTVKDGCAGGAGARRHPWLGMSRTFSIEPVPIKPFSSERIS